jgi:hypothetical protein
VCSTRRRKPLKCTNTEALSIAQMDEAVLDAVEHHALSETFIEELVSLVDKGEVDGMARLEADRDRLRGEVENLVRSIAAGVPGDTVAPAIRQREADIAKLDARLRLPRQQRPDMAKLRGALERRAADWRETLRGEPQVARVLLRRLVGPFEMSDPSIVPPQFTEWIGSLTPALLDDLMQGQLLHLVASPTGTDSGAWLLPVTGFSDLKDEAA